MGKKALCLTNAFTLLIRGKITKSELEPKIELLIKRKTCSSGGFIRIRFITGRMWQFSRVSTFECVPVLLALKNRKVSKN